MTLFRRQSSLSCFYCLSLIDPHLASSSRAAPFDPRSFRCPYCACWNRYDSRGQIIGDEPAMHDERLNAESFAKRGLPDCNRLPSLSTSSPFCRTCQTNQTLLINLRASYLPDPTDPSYATRLAQLPAYIASLQSRYPPVCPSCQPAVDAEIARKNEFARSRALAGALKASSRPPSRAGNASAGVKTSRVRLRTWQVRGALWAASYITAILANITGMLDFRPSHSLQTLIPLLPLIVLTSVTWTFWDPTYSLQHRSQVQGRRVRIEGRQRFIFLQTLVWLSRLSTSILLFCSWVRLDWDFLHLHAPSLSNEIHRKQIYLGAMLTLEVSVLIFSYFAITIHKPMPIRLIDTSVHRALSHLPSASFSSKADAQASSVKPEPELFSTLSLSSNPIITPASVNPMFGQPSLAPGQASSENNVSNVNGDASSFQDEEDYEDDTLPRLRQRDPDAMDWEPATPYKKVQAAKRNSKQGRSKDDGTWLRQQRFFPPEEPTGLEGLLMSTRIMDEDNNAASAVRRAGGSARIENRIGLGGIRWRWGWVYGASVLPVVAVLTALWLRSRS